jgi:hypothetical protein
MTEITEEMLDDFERDAEELRDGTIKALVSEVRRLRASPPLAAEGTADLAAIGGLIDVFEAAVDAFWQPYYEGSDWEVAAARDALDAAIRALAAPSPAPRESTPDPDARVKKGFRIGIEAAARAVDAALAEPGLLNDDTAVIAPGDLVERLRALAASPAPAQRDATADDDAGAERVSRKFITRCCRTPLLWSGSRPLCGACGLSFPRVEPASPSPSGNPADALPPGSDPGRDECPCDNPEDDPKWTCPRHGRPSVAPSPSGNPGKEPNDV